MGKGCTKRLVASSESLTMKRHAPTATMRAALVPRARARPRACAAMRAITST